VAGRYAGYHAEKGVAADSADADLRRDPAVHRELALAGRAVLSALRKGVETAASEIVVQFRVPAALMFPLPRGRRCNATG